MTGIADCLGVFPGKRESRHGVVVEVDRLPGRFDMAALAIGPVAAFVLVVLGVAGIAGGGRPDQPRWLLVAPFAGSRAMRALQRELRHPVMIKAGLLPISAVVARSAIGTVTTLVNIVGGVAADAGARRMRFGITRAVAGGAWSPGMGAVKRKSGAVMVKSGRAPTRRGVA